MKKETVKIAQEVLNEIEELQKYKQLLSDKDHPCSVHFEVRQHYGDCRDYYQVIKISRKHNKRLFDEVDKIILELEQELEKM